MDDMIMIDLETLSDHTNAAILSIGAVRFNIEEGIVDRFYQNVRHEEQLDHGIWHGTGFHKSPRVVEWWKQQSPEARKALLNDRIHIKEMLERFATWYGTKTLPTWSKGASFDLPILHQAYRSVYGESALPPWRFWHGVCMRTVELWYPMPKENREGVYHNALDDAETQAKHLIEFYHRFGMIDTVGWNN